MTLAEALTVCGANICSICGCTWLVWKLRRLDVATKNRLLPRQIFHLALGDIFFHAGSIGYWFLGLSGSDVPRPWVCKASVTMFVSGATISTILEMHIAVALMFQAARSNRALLCLGRLFPWIWLLGGIITLSFAFKLVQASGAESLPLCSRHPPRDNVTSIVILSGLCVCGVAYLFAVVRTLRAPDAVRMRYWRLAVTFPVNFMLTYAPFVVYKLKPKLADVDWFIVMAAACLSLNGIGNTVAYALQSRYATQLRTANQVNQIHEPFQASSPTDPHRGGSLSSRGMLSSMNTVETVDTGSLHVEFGGVDVREFHRSITPDSTPNSQPAEDAEQPPFEPKWGFAERVLEQKRRENHEVRIRACEEFYENDADQEKRRCAKGCLLCLSVWLVGGAILVVTTDY